MVSLSQIKNFVEVYVYTYLLCMCFVFLVVASALLFDVACLVVPCSMGIRVVLCLVLYWLLPFQLTPQLIQLGASARVHSSPTILLEPVRSQEKVIALSEMIVECDERI
jgi:hypothetical protein